MKTIKVKHFYNVPNDFTGLATTLLGEKHWYKNGKIHREEGPCTACKDCLKGNFVLCTKPGPAVEYPNGIKLWYLNGQLHREYGPAIEWSDGTKRWYLNGKLHREDGPAVEEPNGYKGWWLGGYHIDKEKFEKYKNLKQMNYSLKTCLFFINHKYELDKNDI